MASLLRRLRTSWRPRRPKLETVEGRSRDGYTILQSAGLFISFGCAGALFRTCLFDWTVGLYALSPFSLSNIVFVRSADMLRATSGARAHQCFLRYRTKTLSASTRGYTSMAVMSKSVTLSSPTVHTFCAKKLPSE